VTVPSVDSDRTLVGIVLNKADLQRVKEGWYRIPVDAPPTRDERWPPKWFAAFETVAATGRHQAVREFARVKQIRVKTREELIPGVSHGAKAGRQYYQLVLEDPCSLPAPLIPARPRRNPFIYTRLGKLVTATEFNDAFDGSPPEDELWQALRRLGFDAERQWWVSADRKEFFLDFALFCRNRSVDVEVDGRQHHAFESHSIADAERDRALATVGWAVARFTTEEISRRMRYCLSRISDLVQRSGGLVGAPVIRQSADGLVVQPALFEEHFVYDEEWERAE